jgi:hypothetical protein
VNLGKLPAMVIDWPCLEAASGRGETGEAKFSAHDFGPYRLRVVEYGPGYLADHWCSKGHIIYVVAGQLVIECRDGSSNTLTANMSYCIGDDADPPHRVRSDSGATAFIVD